MHLGLDIGGANLKAATADGRAVSVPFALWKEPDKLPSALAELAAQFPETTEFAVTMTGELCDCFETKSDGVRTIVAAVTAVAGNRAVRIWSTVGEFVSPEEAIANHMAVAAANWHALATFVGRYNPHGTSLLVDIGSTTTDIIPIVNGRVSSIGKTDPERLQSGELVYMGVKRTPVCAMLAPGIGAAEFFATMQDVYVLLGNLPEYADDRDTADGRPVTKQHAHARLSRMLCGDPVITSQADTYRLAVELAQRQRMIVADRIMAANDLGNMAITSGSGEFLARDALRECQHLFTQMLSLTEKLGPAIAACAPAYAVAVLAAERPR